MDSEQVAEIFPPFRGVTYQSKDKFPYFTANLDVLLDAKQRGETVAVVGGPCLFGEYEVTVSVVLQDGETRFFDYANGKAYLDGMEFSEMNGLAEYLRLNAERVERIEYQREKWELTSQEYLNLRYPFEIAATLGAPLVIPIPDMSYRKYLVSALEHVSQELRDSTLEAFDQILDGIADLYLEIIAQLQAQFQIEQFICVHRRNQELMNIWYEKRAAYIERRKVLRHLTRLPERLEAVKDYISVPALPFYLFGARNILEVDSVDETDSYRKCKKAHKSAIRLGCIMIPELLSADGIHTVYNAPLQWKEYGNFHDNWSTQGDEEIESC